MNEIAVLDWLLVIGSRLLTGTVLVLLLMLLLWGCATVLIEAVKDVQRRLTR